MQRKIYLLLAAAAMAIPGAAQLPEAQGKA